MAKAGAVDVSVQHVMNRASITILVKDTRRYNLRLWLGKKFLVVAGWLVEADSIKVTHGDK